MLKKDLLERKARYRKALRAFFEEQGFLEAVTPLLVINPGLEPNIQYFETEFKPLMGRGRPQTFYLPTSPEYHLKKILSWGVPKLFEITRSFRNGEWGTEHRPEFEMLEWYRQPGTYEDIARDVEALLAHLWKTFNDQDLPAVKHKKVQELFSEFQLDLEHLQSVPLVAFRDQLKKHKIETHDSDSFEDLFHRAFMQLIEPRFSSSEILFLWDFPAPLRALSKLNSNPAFCKRFEVYWGQVELGNAFDELIDPDELRAVCTADQKRRLERYGKAPPLDEDFIQAHHKLMPQMGGIAMGVDRIFQWTQGAKSLDEVMLF